MIKKLTVVDTLLFALLIIAAVHFVFGMPNALDIELFDESFTLHSGARLWIEGFPAASESPLYSLWYAFLYDWQPNKIQLFFFNSQILTVFTPLLLFVVLRTHSVKPIVSFCLAYAFLFSVGNAYSIPRIGQFALMLMLLSLIGMRFFSQSFRAYAFLSACALTMSFVRPEYFVSFILFGAFFLVTSFKAVKLGKSIWLEVFLLTLLTYSLVSYFGFPLAGGRSFFAFAQHFSLHWTQWTGSELDPWTHWDDIFGQQFCGAKSVVTAFYCDPILFIKHLVFNVLGVIPRLVFLSLPAIHFWGLVVTNALIGFLLLCLLFIVVRHVVKHKETARYNLKRYHTSFMACCIFVLPVLLSIFLIYPRNHYVVILLCIAIVILALITNQSIEHSKRRVYVYLPVMLVMALYGVFSVFPSQSAIAKPNIQTILFIQSLNIDQPVNLLDAEGGFNIYAGDNYSKVVEFNKNLPFEQFIQEKKLNMIVESALLRKEPSFKHDPEWHAFLENYSKAGFERLSIPHTDRILFVHKSLLVK